jgi:hypothetical protein
MSIRLDLERIRGVVENTVKGRFSDAIIDRVTVREATDSDGDPMLRIFVVFKTDAKGVDEARMGGLVRHLRSALDEADSDIFPLVSFLSQQDAKKMNLEAA